jgi:regulator of protease activity HflC (stomatin/prohibitin superfamily)
MASSREPVPAIPVLYSFEKAVKELTMSEGLVVAGFIVLLWISACLNILREYERAVVFRLGRLQTPDKGPGLIFIFWPIDKLVRISLRTVAWDVPPQDTITRDNISVKVNAVVYLRVLSAQRALIELENYRYAIEQLAQTTLRSVLGEVELDDLLSQREKLNARLQAILDEQTEPWGIKVSKVEVKQVDLPQDMQRAIARQAEAERERRAKIINADGEFQASEKLAEAAAVLARQPITITLRYLQTLAEIGTEQNTTIVFPVPVELLNALLPKPIPPVT